MANCPVCNAPISDDFGLIECPSCSAQLIVHIDGRVEHAGAQEAPPAEAEFAPEHSVEEENPPAEQSFDFGIASPEFEMPAETPEAPLETAPAEEAALSFDESAPAEVHDPAPLEAAPPADVFTELPDDQPPAELYQAAAAPAASDSPDLSDIARFGNSNLSSGDGSLRYNVYITGIDTADVRDAFREAITDRKLVWDIDQILRSLKNGEVQIQNVTPPKAYILISRLRNIPVQVRWEQYAISQA